MLVNKFRRGETTYKCSNCKKLTRNTGDEGQATLCVECYDLAGIENHLTDNGSEETAKQYADEIRTVLNRRPELIPLHKELAALVSITTSSKETTVTATKTAPTPKVKTAAETKAPVVQAKKKGLRAPQVRILILLSKHKKPMARKEIAEKAPVDLPFCTEYLGSNDAEVRAKNDAKLFPSLISLKAVKFSNNEEEGGATLYEITQTGRDLLAKHLEDEKQAAKDAKEAEKAKAAAAVQKAKDAKAKAEADAKAKAATDAK